jgi:hypothetical protein
MVTMYVSVWSFRIRLGVTSPMANMRYFHYGETPCTYSDSVLYWIFSPAYKTSLAIETARGDRNMVHWSDRGGGEGYEYLCEQGRLLGV